MTTCIPRATLAIWLFTSSPAFAQTTADPFPDPIAAVEGVIPVSFVEFASVPDAGGQAARMMLLLDEPGTRRLFVNDMRRSTASVTMARR